MAQNDNSPVRSTLANDPEMTELVQMFVSELPDRADAVQAAWSGQKLDDLRRLAHQLRGSSASYGFSVIGDTAGRIEDQLKGMAPVPDSMETVKQTVDELVSLCQRAMCR